MLTHFLVAARAALRDGLAFRLSKAPLLVIVVALTSGSCSSGTDAGAGASPYSRSAREGVSASPPNTEVPSVSATTNSQFVVADVDIKTSAEQAFGALQATAGADAAVAISEQAFFDDTCFVTPGGSKYDECFRSLTDYMTPTAARDWVKNFDGFVQDTRTDDYGKSQSSKDVIALSFYAGMVGTNSTRDGQKIQANLAGPVFTDKQITDLEALVSDDGHLQVDVKASAEAHVLLDGRPNTVRLSRRCSFFMEQQGGRWEVDGWHGGFTFGRYTPEK